MAENYDYDHSTNPPTVRRHTDGIIGSRSTEELLAELVRRNKIRPPECFEGEDAYRWLIAERDWLLGPVALAQHQIRIAEGTFEHDAVQRDCCLGCPPDLDGRNG